MDYESLCERFLRACRDMKDEALIREGYEALKDFSEDDILCKCDLSVGESIRARSIVYLCGEYFKATGRDRQDLREDIIRAAEDFFEY